MSARPLILLSNDDGISAQGLQVLYRHLLEVAEVVVVAPLAEQSAGSHAITLARPLRHSVVNGFHAIDGTPADCIYVGLNWKGLLPRRPDLIVSGINHGYNLGYDTFYSGTVAAAREGALRGIPAIAFSLGFSPNPDFEAIAPIARALVERLLGFREQIPPHPPLLINVNFPRGVPQPKGIRLTRLGRRRYEDEVDVRIDPRGQEYVWIGGSGVAFHDPTEGTDTQAVEEGWVSVSPLALEAIEPFYEGLLQKVIDGILPSSHPQATSKIEDQSQKIRALIASVPDFPKPGVVFRDITPLLADPEAYRLAISLMRQSVEELRPQAIVAIESRGFLFGAPLALELGLPLVPVRKRGKLPRAVQRVEYALEYGTDALEMHRDVLRPGLRTLVVDDVLATGGTARATIELVRKEGGEPVGAAFLIELQALGGRRALEPVPVRSLVTF